MIGDWVHSLGKDLGSPNLRMPSPHGPVPHPSVTPVTSVSVGVEGRELLATGRLAAAHGLIHINEPVENLEEVRLRGWIPGEVAERTAQRSRAKVAARTGVGFGSGSGAFSGEVEGLARLRWERDRPNGPDNSYVLQKHSHMTGSNTHDLGAPCN